MGGAPTLVLEKKSNTGLKSVAKICFGGTPSTKQFEMDGVKQ